MLARKAKAAIFGALAIASAIGGAIAFEAGCTVLTNDALPDDAGVFEGGDAKASSCGLCLSTSCAATQALCLTNASCAAILTCTAGAFDGAADAAGAGDAAVETADASACACGAASAAGPSPDRLYHAYTSCNDAKIAACANDCAAENRAPSTLPACAAPGDAGTADAAAGDAGTTDDAGPADASADADAAPVPGTDACLACAASNCAAAVAACGSGTECGNFLVCSSACTTASCLDDCATQHTTGKVAATELATCTASNCPIACEL